MYLFLTLITASLGIIWSLFFVPFKIFGFKMYKIKDRSVISIINRKIVENSFMIEDNEKPVGFFFALQYAGYVHNIQSPHGDSTVEIYLLARSKTYLTLTNNHDSSQNIQEGYKLYSRRGNFFWLEYASRFVSSKITPTDKQKNVLDDIIKMYNDSANHCISIYLHGEPGSGKSTIPAILAMSLGGSLCKSFKPIEPGDNLDTIYNQVSPTFVNPLIIVFEEIDIWIKYVHDGIAEHKNIPTLIKNKPSWNTFFDDLKILYPNLILVMTSNTRPEVIDALDSSYLRNGRVDKKIYLAAQY